MAGRGRGTGMALLIALPAQKTARQHAAIRQRPEQLGRYGATTRLEPLHYHCEARARARSARRCVRFAVARRSAFAPGLPRWRAFEAFSLISSPA